MHKEHTLFHSLDTIDKSLQFRDHILSTESPTSNHHHSIENRKKFDPIDGISWENSTIPVLTLFTFIDPDSASRSLSLLLCIFICGRSDDSSFLFFCKIPNVSVVGCIVFLFLVAALSMPMLFQLKNTRTISSMCIVSTFIPHTKSVTLKEIIKISRQTGKK